MLTGYQYVVTEGNLFIESQLGNPTFTWQNNTYNCVSSTAEFQRDLETGGFQLERLLTLTVRRFNLDGTLVFTSLPSPQQKLIYSVDGATYRIIYVHTSPEGATIRIKAMCENRGV